MTLPATATLLGTSKVRRWAGGDSAMKPLRAWRKAGGVGRRIGIGERRG